MTVWDTAERGTFDRDAGVARAQPASNVAGWERWVAAILMAAATAPGMLLLGVSDVPGAPENPIFRLYWAPIYLVVAGLCLLHWRALIRVWPALVLTGLLVFWAFFSQAWSILPDITQRRAVALLMTTLIGIYLGAVFRPMEIVRLLAAVFAVLAIGSALVALGSPRLGIEHEPTLAGDWRGLWETKNTLAEFMMLGALAGVCALLGSPGHRWRWAAVIAVCVLLLLMSKGKTSLLCLFVALSVVGALSLARVSVIWATVVAFVTGSALIWGGFLAAVNPGAILTALGKDPTLTGRTDIWAAILRRSPDDPALGFGFGAFWDKQSIPAQIIRKETHWAVPSAHNGWLDLWVQVGWIGVALFAVVLAMTLVLVITRALRLRDGFFSLAFLVVFLILSLSESVLEQHNNLPWSLFVVVLVFAFRRFGPTAEPAGLR